MKPPFASLALLAATLALPFAALHAQEVPQPGKEIPRLEKKDNRYALIVDGKPFLMLGGQIGNSSSWASSLPNAWSSLEAMHANTVEAPVYWELMEPEPGHFDFANVDLLVSGAREHHLRLVLLWFGTWKNGQNHYVPEWVKSDPKKYPRQITSYGKVLDVMSPNSPANLDADKTAFAALMRHVKEIDASQHTVIMIQVENESGGVGSVRDYSAAAQKLFAANVPAALTSPLHKKSGTWQQVFGPDADERFAAFSTSSYINEVAKAGKAEYPLPMYCNVWLTYPVHALENRDRASAGAGQSYPSGGAQQQNIDIWKAAAPAIDVLAPDFYSDDMTFFRQVVAAYSRPDNPLFIPETGRSEYNLGRFFFYAVGHGAIGFSPFGVDFKGPTRMSQGNAADGNLATWLSENFALFAPMDQEVAQWNLDGKLQTAVEQKGMPRQVLHFGDADAVVSYGFPQSDGAVPPGTDHAVGRAMVAQTGPLEFIVTGFDASVTFVQPQQADGKPQTQQLEILRAEEGRYADGAWQMTRIWNGDETDRGLNFRGSSPPLVRIRLHELPLLDSSVAASAR